MFSVLLFATFSGNLIASLSVHKFGFLFNNLEELAAGKEYTLVINKGGAHRTILEVTLSHFEEDMLTIVFSLTGTGIRRVQQI